MKPGMRTFIAFLIILGLRAAPTAAQQADRNPDAQRKDLLQPAQADLIGYGRIKLSYTQNLPGGGAAIFTCQDPAHADQLLSKLRADFTWDKLLGWKEIQLANGAAALTLDGAGVLTLAEKGSAVCLLSSSSAPAAGQLLVSLKLDGADTRFVPLKAHPRSLDFFDLRALDMNYLPFNLRGQDVPGGSANRFVQEVVEKAHHFWAPRGFGVSLNDGTLQFGFSGLSDGPVSVFPDQFTIDMAVAHGQSVMIQGGNTGAPWWLRNKFPRQFCQIDPNVLAAYAPLGVNGGLWLSYNASPDAYAYVQNYTQQLFDRLIKAAGENISTIRPAGGGRPGGELGLHHYSTEFMDYDETGQAAFRRWLRDDRKLTLAALGKRWYDQENHFHTWDEVTIPSNVEFFGNMGKDTYNMQKDWLWRPDRKEAEEQGWGNRDYQPTDQWTAVDLAPSARQLFLNNTQPDDATQRIGKTAWFRKEFEPDRWLTREPGRPVYLVVTTLSTQDEPTEVWINGAYLGKIRPKAVRCGPLGMDVSSLIGPGRNVVCLKVREGIIYGPVFLTREEPRRYPYLGKTQNARWVDLRDWIARRLVESWKREALPLRRRYPDVNFLIMPGGQPYGDNFLEMKQQAGLSCLHDTGGFAGSYSDNWAGLGYTQGLYFTNEEGGTMDDVFAQSRQLAWLLFEGSGHHLFVYNAQSYMKFEQETGWFTNNRRLLEMVGKATRSKPQVAILHTAASERYFPYFVGMASWDVGRGPLQAAHHNDAYVTETEVQNGMVDRYPVLIDDNTSVMSDELLAALERYVRAGGTFVAMHNSGRHTLLDADTWPITRVTGLKVIGERKDATLTIDKGNPLLKKLAGMSFHGSGMALSLAGDPEQFTPIAHWDDGALAIGMRQLGKGRMVVLGSSFWSSRADLPGDSRHTSVMSKFLNDLLAGLGVVKNLECNNEDVWARRMETKNGLQDWMVLWNSSRDRVDSLEVSFPLDHKPSRVMNVGTGAPVEFTYESGMVRVAPFTMAPQETRVLGVVRGDFLAAAAHWMAEKRHFQSRPELPKETAVSVPAPQMPVIDQFRFRQADTKARDDLAWTTEPTTTAAWKDASYGFWDQMGYASTGIGLYRGILNVPADWKGKHVLLALASWDQPVFVGKPTVFLNGRLAGPGMSGGDAPNTVLDVTTLVHQGANDLGILVESNGPRAGFLGSVIAYAQDDLQSAMFLKTGWKLYQDEKKFAAAVLPLKARGRRLEIDVTIPAGWKEDEIFLDFSIGLERSLHDVVVNDHPIGMNWYTHAFPNRMRINLYPWIKPGAVNRIELWSSPTSATAKFDVENVTIGTLGARSSR